ncbi:MAG TPA: hypothetical protein VIL84_02125 [Devosiaceae bacterium]
MSMREVSAICGLLVQIAIGIWFFGAALSGQVAGETVSDAAARVLWAVLAMAVITIATTILGAVLVSIVRRGEMPDGRTDERDRLINARSSRNAYVALSMGIAGTLIALALGAIPVVAVYGVFSAMLLGGIAETVSQLTYRRLG